MNSSNSGDVVTLAPTAGIHPFLRNIFVVALAAALMLGIMETSAAGETAEPREENGAIHVPSPDWRDQIIYSLIIDRFNDGDPQRNDQGRNEYDPGHIGFFSGGDLNGVTEKVGYLKELGVTAVWISPPTATQWWDPVTQYTGYHGYWPVDFMKVDAHFGSLEDYKRLSKTLHGNGMYLIQDAVVNQIGHYYNYAGGHHPENNSINFHLNIGAIPPAPTMPPFNQINLLDPEDAAANIYHWTPSITNYSDPAQQYKYQLQLMNDINTSNPVVRDALKKAYGYWIREVGVDGFRLDAAKHVELEFWEEFLHGDSGVSEIAASTGRHDFLTFGEIFNFSDPLQTNGEDQISSFLGTPERPLFRTVINFPLYEELRRVFIGGMPTSYLAFRLRAQAERLQDPFFTPNFVDNHDVERFISTGSLQAYKQAYTLVMTAPGIPIIYQGDEQAFSEVRRAMFAGGYRATSDAFDQSSEMFLFLKSLTGLRKAHPALRRGALTILRENAVAAGVLAFKRETEDETIFVIMNSSGQYSTLLNAMPTGLIADTPLQVLHDRHITEEPVLDSAGRLTMALPPYAVLVLKAAPKKPPERTDAPPIPLAITATPLPAGKALVSGDRICGRTALPNAKLRILTNGNLSNAVSTSADESGNWCAQLPSLSLDSENSFLEVYAPALGTATPPLPFISRGETAYQASHQDVANDHRGPDGVYTFLTDDPSHVATDIRAVNIRANEDLLELAIEAGEIKNVWAYINKFDHVAFSIFVDAQTPGGARELPGLNARMPERQAWDFSHRLFGMGSAIHLSEGASATRFGRRLDIKPQVTVNAEDNTITILYRRAPLGIRSWAGAKFYITTWDADEFGAYRPLGAAASARQFGGGDETSPRIFDEISFEIPEFPIGAPASPSGGDRTERIKR